MKTSVIFGVVQMLMGTCMKGFNAVYFKDYIELVFECFTQLLLLTVLFGFMDYMIIIKWLTNWNDDAEYLDKGLVAPGIINSMIIMFINFGSKPEALSGDLEQADLMPNQKGTMRMMLYIAGICVPLMLSVKPLYVKFTQKAPKKHEEEVNVEMVAINSDFQAPPAHDNSYQKAMTDNEREFYDCCQHILADVHPHEFGEVLIHSMIETIEYALGTVSNTASYLRLWALSLAHGQLAKVFFDYTIRMTIDMSFGYIACFVSWYVFFAITFSVLMVMDLLEAALHCLRLHWVEFNNKFYKGEGYAFRSFSIEKVIEA